MDKLKPLYEILGEDDQTEELYSTDQKWRKKRAYKGLYSRQKGLFSFLQLIKSWEDIVGDFMAKNTTPLKIKNQTLFISTKHSIFAQELGFLGPTIIQKIKVKYPELEGKLKQIKFLYSDFSSRDFNTKQEISPERPKTNPPKQHRFSPYFIEKQNKAKKIFEDIQDEETRNALIDFYINHVDSN